MSAPPAVRTTMRSVLRALWPWLLMLCALMAATPARADAPVLTYTCPARSSPATGPDYSGKTVNFANFTDRDLTNANFKGATLKGVVFIRANLTGADFSGATFVDAGPGPRTNDFSFANLDSACFIGAQFTGRTYFSYAKLPCADFSKTDLTVAGTSGPNLLFGPGPIAIDTTTPRSCRPRFWTSTMNCEFVSQWKSLDMIGANVKSCGKLATQPGQPGIDFSGGIFNYVDFSGLNLANTRWTHAALHHAVFDNAILDGAKGLGGDANNPQRDPSRATNLWNASLQSVSAKNVDFSNGLLYGADFTQSELSGANFANAALTNKPDDPNDPVALAAVFDGARLKYANFAGASLQGVSFKNASVYGQTGLINVPPAQCATVDPQKCGGGASCPSGYEPCGPGNNRKITGWTCSCATMRNADLTRTVFSNAFLYGVDFSSGTQVNATDFSGAVLVGANFAQAIFNVDPTQGGAGPQLDQSWVQGVDLSAAQYLASISLSGAYVDFGVLDSLGNLQVGNTLIVQLTKAHASFPGWTGNAAPCVGLVFGQSSQIPVNDGSMTCPDGKKYASPPNPTPGCGAMLPGNPPPPPPPAQQVNPHWYAGAASDAAPIRGWYLNQSTYDGASDLTAVCGGNPLDSKW